jgi:hypothetical protein
MEASSLADTTSLLERMFDCRTFCAFSATDCPQSVLLETVDAIVGPSGRLQDGLALTRSAGSCIHPQSCGNDVSKTQDLLG